MLKQNFKRRLILVMLGVFSLGVAGCGKQTEVIAETKEAVAEVEVVPEEDNLLSAAEGFAGGDGSEESPYQIATAEQLVYLSEMINSEDNSLETINLREGYYVLTDNIELNDLTDFDNWETQAPQYEWNPIANTAGNEFKGHFDGNGYAVKGMYIESDYSYSKENLTGDGSSIGLFGYLTDATVENVVIEDSLIVANNDVRYAGSIAGHSMGSEIVNCHSSAKLKINMAEECGGIVGYAINRDDFEGNIGVQVMKDCVYNGTLIFLSPEKERMIEIGGVVGRASGIMENCSNKGTMQLEGEYKEISHEIGGIAGVFSLGNDSMSGCINEADIEVDGNPTLGGVCGSLSGMSEFSDESASADFYLSSCSNTGKIAATGEDSCVGGVIGSIGAFGGDSIVIEKCTNSGSVFGGLHVGGICGESINSTTKWEMANCTNSGSVDSGLWTGGIMGYIGSVQEESVIKNCVNEGKVAGRQEVGGIAGGYFAYNVAQAESRAPFTIANCENKGIVSHTERGISGLGGIIGYLQLDEPTDMIYIDGCKNSGVVSGKETLRAGGIVGSLSTVSAGAGGFCSITNCENTGDIMQEGGTIEVTADLAKDGELSFENAEDKAWSIIGGSSMGGITGYFKQGVIENCVSTGSFYILDGVNPMFSYADLSKNLNDDATESQVFVGGICGLYYYEDGSEGYTPETCYVRNCRYADSIPEGVVYALPDEATMATVSDVTAIKGTN